MTETTDKRQHVRTAIRAVVFVALAAAVFVYLNLAFVSKGDAQDKGNYNSFYAMPADTVDVVYVGTSAVSRFFINPLAFHEYGITSYGFGARSSAAFFYDNLVDEALKTQKPKLVILELRSALKGYDGFTDSRFHLTIDALSLFSENRIPMSIDAVNALPEEDLSVPDYLFPIVKYHERLLQGRMKADDWLLKTEPNLMQGFMASEQTRTQAPQNPKFVSEPAELDEAQKQILDELMQYCSSLDADVLFVISPFATSKNKSGKLLAIEEYVKSKGFDILNCTREDVCEEIGLDWQTDFYNKNHTNYLGAEKYTRFLCDYLEEHYDLPDHRGDANCSIWEQGYAAYLESLGDGTLYASMSDVPDDA